MALFESQKIIAQVDEEILLLQCRKCNMKFTLTAVLDKKGGKDWENEQYYGAPRYQLMPQASAYYCPYCGVKDKKG